MLSSCLSNRIQKPAQRFDIYLNEMCEDKTTAVSQKRPKILTA